MADDEDQVLESWEDADTEELERRMEERQKQLDLEKNSRKRTNAKQNKSKGKSKGGDEREGSPAPAEIQTQLPLRIQDSDRTEYVAPIKILRRETDSRASPESSSASATNTSAQKQFKSLAEREAEYASARARILGSPGEGPPSTGPAKKIVSKVTDSISTPETVKRPADNVKRQPKGPGPNGSAFAKDSRKPLKAQKQTSDFCQVTQKN